MTSAASLSNLSLHCKPWRGVQPCLLVPLGRRLLHARLRRLQAGRLVLREGDQVHVFGEPSTQHPDVTLTVNHPWFYRAMLLGGNLGAADAYLDGHWDCDDLTGLFALMLRNQPVAEGDRHWLTTPGRWLANLGHALRANTRRGSRRNIRDHYDLGNNLFQIMLDPTMAYSCAVFEPAGCTLEQASVAKFDRICRKLDLGPDDHLLEIGTGWGGLAIHAARWFGCRVTTTTISQQQYDWTRRRLAEEGLQDRVELLLEDYRDLRGRYDKVVSIEMIEAVGHRYLPGYFGAITRLLKPQGLALIQAITMPDQRYPRYLRSTDFIQRYIFPGSCVPSMAAMTGAMARGGDLRLIDVEEIGPHYATTLRCWRQRFNDQIAEVRALGYPPRFERMWNYYLCYCEAGFAERYLGNVQMVLSRPNWRGSVRGGV